MEERLTSTTCPQAGGASLALCAIAGFFFAFRVCLTFLWFQADAAQGSAVIVVLSVGLYVAAFTLRMVDPPEGSPRRASPMTMKVLTAYLLLAACSLLWTTVPSLTSAFAYWLGMAADVGTVLLLLEYRPILRQATSLMQGYIWGVAVVALVAWFAPAMDDFRLGNEDFFHPNEIGFELGIATLFAMCLGRRNKAWKWVAAALAITLLRDLSKGSIAAFILAALFFLMKDSSLGHKVRFRIAMGAAAVIACFWTVLEAYADVYTQGSNVETLTGRTVIWSTTLEIALEKPWLGHGFYSYRWAIPPFGDFAPMHAHNEVLQQFFTYGLVGVVALVALYGAFYRQIRDTPASRFTTLAGALLVFAIVRGLVDTERFDLSYPLWLVALSSMLLANASSSELT